MIQSENTEKEKRLATRRMLASAVVCVSLLLELGFVFQLVPRRVGAIVILLWFVLVILLLARLQSVDRKRAVSDAKPTIYLDDKAVRWSERWILLLKVWIGVLAVSLPLGIANGIVQHQLLAIFIGAGINLLMMYVAAREIRRMQKLIRLSTQNRPDIKWFG
jgi:hypothetical protein